MYLFHQRYGRNSLKADSPSVVYITIWTIELRMAPSVAIDTCVVNINKVQRQLSEMMEPNGFG